MLTPLLVAIESMLIGLPDPVQQALADSMTRQTFQKGDYLLREGELCRYSYLIDSGLARKYYLVDGREITTEFYFPRDLALSLTSYTLQTPSPEWIQVGTGHCPARGLWRVSGAENRVSDLNRTRFTAHRILRRLAGRTTPAVSAPRCYPTLRTFANHPTRLDAAAITHPHCLLFGGVVRNPQPHPGQVCRIVEPNLM